MKVSRFLWVAVFAAAALAVSWLRVFDTFELATLDARFLLRPPLPARPEILLVEIDDQTLDALGRFPFDRRWHAKLVDHLSRSGARAILFDILFSEPSPSDAALARAVRESGRVYLPYALDIERSAGPGLARAAGFQVDVLPELRNASKGDGFINLFPDSDGKNRRVPLFIQYGNARLPQLSFRLACDLAGIGLDQIRLRRGSVRLSDGLVIPVDARAQMLVNFAGPWETTFQHVSFLDVIRAAEEAEKGFRPRLSSEHLKGKVALVALTATGTHDLNPIPLAARYPGVGVHANVINSILEGRFLTRLPRWFNGLVVLAVAALLVWAGTRLRPIPALSVWLGGLAGFSAAACLLFVWKGVWIDAFFPALAGSLGFLGASSYRIVSEMTRREVLENEIKTAREIQKSFLPQTLPRVSPWEFAGRMLPAREVGGDLYDFLELKERSLGVMIGDVSGKGVPAALFMAKIATRIRTLAREKGGASELLSHLNEELVAQGLSGIFVTTSYVVATPSGRVHLASGGHPDPLLWRADRTRWEPITGLGGLPVGLVSDGGFQEVTADMRPGDFLVLYTDGVTEARNRRGEEYGEERLRAACERLCAEPAGKMIDGILEDLLTFRRMSLPADDTTLVVLKQRG